MAKKRYNKSLLHKNYYSLGSDLKQAFSKDGKGLGILGSIGGGIAGSALSGGLQSGAGNVLQSLSGVASAIPGPWGAAIGAGLQVLGGATNALFGSKMNNENIAKVQNSIDRLNSFKSNASSFDELSSNWANADMGILFDRSFIGKDGVFSNKVSKKYNSLKEQMFQGQQWVNSALDNNATNIADTQLENLLADYKAFGGELGTNGADFTNGMIEINSGGTHEQNPNEGVIFGIDQEGVPNLVEEGEVIYNNYVFSNRIKVPKELREQYKLDNVTFADAIKELSKESEERPNDPISRSGLNDIVQRFMISQEMTRKTKNKGRKFALGGPKGETIVTDYQLPILDTPTALSTSDRIQIGRQMYDAARTSRPKGTSNPSWLKNLANLRYIPAIGSSMGAITDSLGWTNKPNYEGASILLDAAKTTPASQPIKFDPIGNYLTFKPFDRDFHTSKLLASAGATRRGLLNNSGGNRSQAAAGLLASDYNTLGQLGNLARNAEEYNMNQMLQIEGFNRGTNQFNKEGQLKADIATAENRLKESSFRYQNTIAGAQMKQAAKDAADAAKSANLTNLLDNIGNIGWEEFSRNMINSNPALLDYYISRVGNLGYGRKAKGGFLTIKKKK